MFPDLMPLKDHNIKIDKIRNNISLLPRFEPWSTKNKIAKLTVLGSIIFELVSVNPH
jgi:hypothetical protein